jgi:hypothetical protein
MEQPNCVLPGKIYDIFSYDDTKHFSDKHQITRC